MDECYITNEQLLCDILSFYERGFAVDRIAAEFGISELEVVNILDKNCPEFVDVI